MQETHRRKLPDSFRKWRETPSLKRLVQRQLQKLPWTECFLRIDEYLQSRQHLQPELTMKRVLEIVSKDTEQQIVEHSNTEYMDVECLRCGTWDTVNMTIRCQSSVNFPFRPDVTTILEPIDKVKIW